MSSSSQKSENYDSSNIGLYSRYLFSQFAFPAEKHAEPNKTYVSKHYFKLVHTQSKEYKNNIRMKFGNVGNKQAKYLILHVRYSSLPNVLKDPAQNHSHQEK
jgi:hypothetical protein